MVCNVVRDKIILYYLIELLESSTELWNCTLNKHKDSQQKATFIEIIAGSLKINTAKVKIKLHNLQYKMTSELRKKKNKKSEADADDAAKSYLEYFDALRFYVCVRHGLINRSIQNIAYE